MAQTFTSFQDFKRRYPIRPNDKGSLLGSGSYGRVIKVEDQLETEWVAIKISEFKGNDTKSLRAEVELAQRVPRQANIARYDACHRLETDASVSDFAIMKYYPDGNLADLLRHVTLTPTQIYEITQGILLGLQHLHRHRIVHRDFKPANILISRDNAGRFIPKIADFGLSKLVSDDELDSSDFDLSDGRGTPSYKAPEQIEGSRVSFNLDLWAFGVILYEIMTGEKPFRADLKNSSEQSIRREIEKKIITVELPARLNQVSQPYRSMIQRCLVRDIHERVRKEDELLDLLDGIPQLMVEANAFFNREQYKEALGLFEQVLTKREHHAEAARGLALCIDRLRPKPSFIESELTDVYQEESTDMYVAPPASVTAKTIPKPASVIEAAAPVKTSARPSPETELLPDPAVLQPVSRPISGAFPWRIVAPAAVIVGGLVWYFNTKNTTQADQIQRSDIVSTAPVITHNGIKPVVTPTTEKITLKPLPGQSKHELDEQIDIALGKARRAYLRKDYDGVIIMTNSALHLDPTRRDVATLRNAALKEIEKKPLENDKPTVPATPTSELPKAAVATVEADKPKSSEPIAKENPVNTKRQAQEDYDQLIEEGMKAITSGNNKAKAITTFNKAQALAKEHDLNTDKGDEAYAYNLNKGKNYFDRDEFDGAKGWYQVAQALKDTDEVRRKIKQCTNQ